MILRWYKQVTHSQKNYLQNQDPERSSQSHFRVAPETQSQTPPQWALEAPPKT